MLYGLEDYEFDHTEYSLVKRQQLNIKKVIIVALIALAILATIIVVTVNVHNHNSNNDNNQDDVAAVVPEQNDNTIVQNSVIQNLQITPANGSEVVEEPVPEMPAEEVINTGENAELANEDTIPEHNLDEIKNAFIPQFNENGHQLIKDIYYSDEKQVYLTFDDGPTRAITPQILDILNQYNVKATFFVLGRNVDLYPDLIQREYNEGHYIANHGYTHEYSKIYRSKDTTFEEYAQTENSIKNALGNPDFNTYLFRFPGGSNGGRYESVKREARAMFDSYGIAYTNWNCLTGDAEGKNTAEDCFNEMIRTKGDQNSIILLMHDAANKQQTVEALPSIIQYYIDNGYTFKTFYEIY